MQCSKKKNLRITTTYGNNYLINRSIPQVIQLHPILNYLLKRFAGAAAIKQWLDGLQKDELIEIEPNVTTSKEDILYYYNYYLFLEARGYFKDSKKKELTDSTYTAELVKYHLVNTRQIVLEVCNTCGLECKYCGYGDLYSGYDKRENEMMAPETAKRFLDYMAALQTSPLHRKAHKEIALSFYGGEPTDNMPLVKELVRYVREGNLFQRRLIFSMTTNGLHLDRHMDYLAENRFHLLISLDGNEAHNSYRTKKNSKSSFDEVFKNILKLKEKHPSYFEHFVGFNAVIHNRNSRKDVVEFFRENFGKVPGLAELTSVGVKPEKRQEFDKMFRNRDEGMTQDDLDALAKDNKRILESPLTDLLFFFLRSYSGFIFKNYDKLLDREKNICYAIPGTCHPFQLKVFLTVKGKILPCERISQIHGLGAVDENCVHLDFQEIADSYNRYHGKLKEQCNRCFRIDSCPTCMFVLSQDADDKPVCENFMSESVFRSHLRMCLTELEKMPKFYSRILNDFVRF